MTARRSQARWVLLMLAVWPGCSGPSEPPVPATPSAVASIPPPDPQPTVTVVGHLGYVNGVCFSPDGQRLATASYDRTVKVWDVASGKLLATLGGDGDYVNRVVFSPDGKYLAADRERYHEPGQIKLYDAATGKELHTLAGHGGPIGMLAFSPDSARLASASADGTARVWEVATGKPVFNLTGHLGPVTSVTFSSDGKQLATAGGSSFEIGQGGGEVRIWDAVTGALLLAQALPRRVESVAFSPTEPRLAVASGSEVRIWDTLSGGEPVVLPTERAFAGAVFLGVTYRPDGQYLLGLLSNGTARVWEVTSGRPVSLLAGGGGQLAFSSDGKLLAGGGDQVTVWDAASGRPLLNLVNPAIVEEYFNLVTVLSPDSRLVVRGRKVAGTVGEVTVREARSGQELHRLRHDGTRIVAALFNRDGSRLITAGGDLQKGEFKVWDTATGRELFGRTSNSGAIRSVQFSWDGRQFLTGSRFRDISELRIWDLATGEELQSLRRPRLGQLLFTPDNQLLEFEGGRARDVFSGQDCWDLPVESRWGLAGVVPAADGRTVGTVELADAPGRFDARLWDVTTGRERARLRGHTDQILTLCFSPDSKHVATAGNDKNVIVWDAATGQPLWIGRGHAIRVVGAAFSTDGRELVSLSLDGKVCVWDTATGQLTR